MGNFGSTLIHFHVLESDAVEWFNEVYSALQDPENFTAIESPFAFTRRENAADQASKAGDKQKVSDETIRKFYPVIRDVGLEKLPRPDGIDRLNKVHGVSRLYARSFIDMFLKMLRGEQYKRQLTVFTTELFLEKIGPDFGDDALRRAVLAVKLHLDYRPQKGIRAVLNRYKHLLPVGAKQQGAVARQAKRLSDDGEFNPDDIKDARRWVLTSIARRQGQPEFRRQLLDLYDGRCAVSGSRIEAVLEAAHIVGYQGPKTNHPQNGLLLRSDLHTLFDLRLIAVNTESMTLLVSPELEGSSYEKFAGRKLRLPEAEAGRPSARALDQHRKKSGLY